MRDLDRIQEVSEYRVTGPQVGSLVVLVLLLVSGAGLAGYQAGIWQGPVDEELLSPSKGTSAGGSAVLADMLAERERAASPAPAGEEGEGIDGVPPRMGAPELGSSLSDPDPDLAESEAAAAGEVTPAAEAGESSEPAVEESATEAAEPSTEAPAEPETPAVVEAATPAPADPAPDASAAGANNVPTDRGFTVQLAAYPSPKEADELVSSLRAAGFGESFYQKATVSGRTWYRVRVGVYKTRGEAESAAGRLAGVSPYDPYITTHP